MVVGILEANRNPENAVPMEKYLRNNFSFLGIKTPLRRELVKKFFKETDILTQPLNHSFILALWEKEEREYQYAALDYIGKSVKKLTKEDLPLIEHLLITKSWWDTVDMLAANVVGAIAKRNQKIIEESIENWASSTHLWLRRTAILFQLKYKEETNEALLYEYIKRNKDSKEFFIQKAIGWALREYSKTNPYAVKRFIEATELPKLSVREGSKYLK
ncbi:DNA alkylation repair protein [Caldibacillus lycopersici]|uniref:DNA alkylation repair protein n=2 Tax=Perspicuibacillus lycopersici TaxID=1325689 RepID=A0AAE3IPG1_9BACI|nr:DNA alkylation repair protein [Perspicuibacillus lycopersici]